MADGNFTHELSPTVLDYISVGIHGLYKQSIGLLKIQYNNGFTNVPFSQASCNIEEYEDRFSFAYLFHYGLKELLEIKRNGDWKRCSDKVPIENLIKVLDKNTEIAERLLLLQEEKEKTAHIVQLAHHLLVPLSQKKVYKIDHQSRDQTKKCVCCKEKITGTFADTSMGNEDVWHGSTDILIGESNDISITVNPDDDDGDNDDDDEFHLMSQFEIKPDPYVNLLIHRNELIAKTIVFGFLQSKWHISLKNATIPTIEITKNKVKIFLYDAKHDFLLETFNMRLFLDKTVGLNPSAVIALWLAINYPLTCSGLTEMIVSTDYTADFLKNFQENVKEKYKNRLKFGNCQRKRIEDSDKDDIYSQDFNTDYAMPYEGKFGGLLTEEDKKYISEEAGRAKKRLKQTL